MSFKPNALIDIEDLDVSEVFEILDTARAFKEVNDRDIKKLPTLRGRTIINLFLEPSTRTRTSFEIAGKRLSADVINFSAASSSTKKGETLIDTAKTLDAMNSDMVIIRSSQEGAARLLKRHIGARIINAGDGKHQHPTQALLDAFTMREKFGSLDGLNVGIVGDISHSRVVGSLLPLLIMLGANPTLIAPPTLMPAKPHARCLEAAYKVGRVCNAGSAGSTGCTSDLTGIPDVGDTNNNGEHPTTNAGDTNNNGEHPCANAEGTHDIYGEHPCGVRQINDADNPTPLRISYNLDDVLPELDVLYMLRIQTERLQAALFPSLREYALVYGLDCARLGRMKKDSIIMHPGPINRGVELSSDAADAANSLILDQVNAGVAVRMACMYLLLGGEAHGVTS